MPGECITHCRMLARHQTDEGGGGSLGEEQIRCRCRLEAADTLQPRSPGQSSAAGERPTRGRRAEVVQQLKEARPESCTGGAARSTEDQRNRAVVKCGQARLLTHILP